MSAVVHLPLVIIGPGRVGKALLRMADPQQPTIAVGRHDHLAHRLAASGVAAATPLLVTTTNDALEQVIAGCPPDQRSDLLFTQNGMLLPLLERHGLACNTQALLYMSAVDGSVVDGGRTVACGRWAPELAALLSSGGVDCRVVHQAEYLALLIDKLCWASIYWLLSAGLGGLPVGAIAEQHGDAAEELAAELLPLAQRYVLDVGQRLGLAPVDLQQVEALTVPGVCSSMARYSLSIPEAVPSRAMALAEFRWRNGWFLEQRRTPVHLAWLARAGMEA